MTQLNAFIYKEFLETVRNSKLLILGTLFVLFGIMNPAFAKLTPWLMETLSESLEDSGLVVAEVTVDALTSWAQFYKNIPMAMIIFLLMFSGIMTLEYQKGTLINMITKGLSRWKVVASKTIVMSVLWTAGYWLCYGITYVYNEYFWDNGIASNLLFSAGCVYLLGLWLITLMMLMSTIFSSGSSVAVSTGAVFMIMYIIGMLPDVEKFLPVRLFETSQMIMGTGGSKDFFSSIIVTIVLIIVDVAGAVVVFNKRNM